MPVAPVDLVAGGDVWARKETAMDGNLVKRRTVGAMVVLCMVGGGWGAVGRAAESADGADFVGGEDDAGHL